MRDLLPDLSGTSSYFLWLVAISLAAFLLERIRPWRASQRILRREFAQDFFWLLFNGHLAGALLGIATGSLLAGAAPAIEQIEAVRLIGGQPFWVQFLAFFLLKDFLDWCVHNLLHRVPWLWEFHKVHHSIRELDWLGHLRFHWMEILVYRAATYAPLAILGVDAAVIASIAVSATLIGHLNHSNLDITWGPLRYILNSPRMHIWHHAAEWPEDRRRGVNFGVSLSLWDWLFGTAWWPDVRENPAQQPRALGFSGIERYPDGLPGRLLHPLPLLWTRSFDRAAGKRAADRRGRSSSGRA